MQIPEEEEMMMGGGSSPTRKQVAQTKAKASKDHSKQLKKSYDTKTKFDQKNKRDTDEQIRQTKNHGTYTGGGGLEEEEMMQM